MLAGLFGNFEAVGIEMVIGAAGRNARYALEADGCPHCGPSRPTVTETEHAGSPAHHARQPGRVEVERRTPIDQKEIARRLHSARSATLGTVDDRGRPHLVPIVFAYDEGRIYNAVDHKPKSTYRLKRLRNVAANPHVSVLVDHYDDDWSRLWWIRVDGTAEVVGSGPRFRRALALLADKYADYVAQPPPGPIIEVRVENVRAWSATSTSL